MTGGTGRGIRAPVTLRAGSSSQGFEMTQWYFHTGSGDRIGPFDDSAAQQYAQQHPAHFCWREGFTGWRPIAEVGELRAAPTGEQHLPPPMPSAAGARATSRNDDIDYRIVGNDMQFVE